MTSRPFAVAALALLLPLASHAADPTPPSKISLIDRPVPDLATLKDDAYGKMARYGYELATRTFAHIGPEVRNPKMRYAGNNLACTSCHQNGATKPYAMPWVGVHSTFPMYRSREDQISTLEERINGCMERSMNGKPLPLNSTEMKAFVTYMHFLSRDIPIGAEIEGQLTKPTQLPNRRADVKAGEAIFKTTCVACHGENGAGRRVGKVGDAQGYVFPQLWGKDTFNNSTGMHRLITATRFIKYNMPQGVTHTTPILSDEEAYDVAAYVLSQSRPQRPHLERDFPARWNKPVDSAFPPYVDGASADQHKYGPFPPLLEQQAKAKAKATSGM